MRRASWIVLGGYCQSAGQRQWGEDGCRGAWAKAPAFESSNSINKLQLDPGVL